MKTMLSAFGLAVLVIVHTVAMRAQAPAVPPYLHLVSARIHEEPPFEATARANRQVVFTLVVSGQPRCTQQSAAEYAFLLDRDGVATTGVRLAAVPEIGAEGRILMRCDPSRGAYVSGTNPVTVRPDQETRGAYLLEVRTRLGDLPASAFRWVAVAKEGDVLYRIPDSGQTAPWKPYEAALW